MIRAFSWGTLYLVTEIYFWQTGQFRKSNVMRLLGAHFFAKRFIRQFIWYTCLHANAITGSSPSSFT